MEGFWNWKIWKGTTSWNESLKKSEDNLATDVNAGPRTDLAEQALPRVPVSGSTPIPNTDGNSVPVTSAAAPQLLSTSPTDTPVELYVLPHHLHICSIPKTKINLFTHSLIKVAFLPDSRPEFFSFAEANEKYTVVLTDKDFYHLLNTDELETSGIPWMALTVSTGAMGSGWRELVGVTKIAKSVICPLADNNISVYSLSTYQADYILVQEPTLPEALKCLGKYFKIFNEQNEKLAGPKRGENVFIFNDSEKERPIIHSMSSPTIEYHVTGIDTSLFPNITQVLLEMMFFSDTKNSTDDHKDFDKFFNFSVIDGDISLVLDNESLGVFPSNTLYASGIRERWKLIKIGDTSLGFEEPGIVAQVTQPLANAQISSYYISTFDNDYSLVPAEELENVMEVLNKRISRVAEPEKK